MKYLGAISDSKDLVNKGYVDNAIPTNVSAFTNDAGYITGYTETDPTVPSWAKASSKPTYTASEVGWWAARRMILDYLLILIDDSSRPDDWLDIRDKEPLRNVFEHLGYRVSD